MTGDDSAEYDDEGDWVAVKHLLCSHCKTAIICDTIAKRKRISRWSECPACGRDHGETWRPVVGTPDALSTLVGGYETTEAEDVGWSS